MANIYTWMGVLVLIIIALKTTDVDGRRFKNQMINLRLLLDSDELSAEDSPEKRLVSQSQIVEYVAVQGTAGADRFDCTQIKNSLKRGGVCILPLNEAIAYCNADPECSSIGITTNVKHHKTYDLPDRMPVAELFKGSRTVSNGEWTLYIKQGQ